MFSSNTSQVSSGGYEIQRSLRFNQADDTYLNRTPASAGTRTTWTWSAWIKRATISDFQYSVFGAGTGSNYDEFRLTTADKFRFFIVSGGSVVLDLLTTQVFRDPSAWYHFVVAYDSTQATASNRCKLYVNGAQITALDTATYPAQNTNTTINNNVAHNIGLSPSGFEYNGYMTEVNFIDGQALTPSSFGAFDAQTGVWGPTRYAGSYGTNGFYLNFSDNSNTTAATLGKDYSPNGNNWTPNNFSVSAGAGNDSLVDVPTNWGTDTGVGGSVRGNYCTLNPLYGNPAPTNGNLEVTVGNTTAYGSLSFTSGKWYWEVTPTVASGALYIGVMNSAYIRTDGAWGSSTARTYVNDGATFGSNGGTYGASYTANDIIGIALDMDAGSITFYKNGTSQGTAFTNLSGNEWRSLVYATGTSTFVCNFGQRPFAYTAPSGFKALNTQNLPTPTIGATTATQAGKFFNPVLFTGNGTLNVITGVGFQPDLVWWKSRSNATNNVWMDAVRGAGNELSSNDTAAEGNTGTAFTSFDSNGFTLNTASGTYNGNGRTFVAWNWKANGAGVTNTAGSITSTVSANTTSGFSVVTYGGNGANSTIGHGLGAAPRMVIVKRRGAADAWIVYHASVGNTGLLVLNTTAAASTSSAYWNNTSPTSSVFTVGTAGEVNTNGSTFVAYCFAEVPGYSSFGSYVGTGSTDGPFVFTGFRPAYVMIKASSAADFGSWRVHDTKRSPSNVVDRFLFPNLADAEPTFVELDILSNGFKIRENYSGINANGQTLIFVAFAEAPQKFALAR